MHSKDETGFAAPSFRAFLSYSHADKTEARRFHRKLENYRLPKQLRMAANASQSEGRIGPIFRDREDFPAAEDLTASVKQALAASQALVVLCSPAAKASPWVAREIALFRELHPNRPVLAALLRGEPDDAFPELLREGGEPLAADLRIEGDGTRLGFLKVMAGIVGVPLDALVQRDSQKQMRRVMTVTSIVAGFAAIMTVMTYFAITARNQAEMQWRTTQEFNTYFMTDFRKKMLGIGRLDIAIEFYARTLNYCRNQRKNFDLEAGEGAECARLVEIAGMDYEQLGKFDVAREYYLEAHAITAASLAAAPGDPNRVLAHAISENRLGAVDVRTNELRRAAGHFSNAQDMVMSIEDWGMTQDEWLREASYIAAQQGSLAINQGKLDQIARQRLGEAVEYNRLALQRNPNDSAFRYDLAFHLTWLAHGELLASDLERYREYASESLAISKLLVDESPSDTWLAEQRMELLVRHYDLSRKYSVARPVTEELTEAKKINAKLFKIEPNNKKWKEYRERILSLEIRR